MSESPRCRHLSVWVLLMEELLWKGLSTMEPLLIPSASQSRDLQGSAPPVPPLFPFICPRGIHQSPNPQKPAGRRCRNLRPENLRLVHLSLPSPCFPLLQPYLRAVPKQEANNIFYSSPCTVSQGEVNQPPLFPGCPVLPGISDHTNTSLSPWRGLGHPTLLLAASHKPSLWLPVTATQCCQDKSHPKDWLCLEYQTRLESRAKISEHFLVEGGGAFIGFI